MHIFTLTEFSKAMGGNDLLAKQVLKIKVLKTVALLDMYRKHTVHIFNTIGIFIYDWFGLLKSILIQNALSIKVTYH